MADAVVSIAIERLAAILEEKIRDEINLVRGVEKELRYLSSELTSIRNVLDDAESKRYKEKTIQQWLKKLEDVSQDVDDVLDEWNYALLKHRIEGSEELDVPQPKVSSFIPCSCLCFKQYAGRRDIAVKIKGLKERLEVIMKEKDRYNFEIKQPAGSERDISGSFVNELHIHGRDAEKDALVRKLIFVGQNEFGPTVISIVGTGGIGKTTLAQYAYKDPQVINSFELKIWICVSDVFNVVEIAKGIVDQIVKENPPSTSNLEALLIRVRDLISGQRFLLVLDDVWTEDYKKWEPFKNTLDCGSPGSKILVTTRNERVARVVGTTEIHRLGLLSDIDCWLLMRRIAFSGRSEVNYEEFEEIGEKIAKKCKGLPLAATFLGRLLCFKDSVAEWENILLSEIWQLEEAEGELFPHLILSYNELSPAMKRCFSYCAVFPKDSEIDIEKLIGMWMALGYLSSNGGSGDLELRGKEYFDNLRMRSFFQDFNVSPDGRELCKMHDIVHDFAHSLRNTTDHIQEDVTTPSSISQVKLYRTLYGQVEHPPYQLESVTCLRLLSYEELNMDECEWEELLQFIVKLIHLRYLTLINVNDFRYIDQFPQTICKLYNLQRLELFGFGFKEVPKEIGNLIHLRHLYLSFNSKLEELPETVCNLQELRTLNLAMCILSKLPQGIGNLIRLRELDLSYNPEIRELPETIFDLQELRTLNLFACFQLLKLPEGIHRLINLKHLNNGCTISLNQIPQGLEQLTGLQTLIRLPRDTKLGCLKKLDQLSGSLELEISIYGAEDVMEAKKANLRNKKHIKDLFILFHDHMSESDDDNLIRNDIMESLQLSPFLQCLKIGCYSGTKFPGWITSSLNQLRVLELASNYYCSILPPLGKLPCLEEFSVDGMDKLIFLNREFLGIPAAEEIETSFDVVIVGFPKLRKLTFGWCSKWKLWEDITDEEAANDNLSIMPCLTQLCITACDSLIALPHRLLRKASTLVHLKIERSPHLSECYKDKDGSGRRSLSHIQNFEI